MKNIYKYALEPGSNVLYLPVGSEILSAINQREEVVLYALVPRAYDGTLLRWRVRVAPTGDMGHYSVDTFVGTVALAGGDLIYHVFAEVE